MNQEQNKPQTANQCALALAENVGTVAQTYEKIANASGENFNLFKTLKIESDEVRTHSRFIGELLNPKGSHGMNEAFLEAFLKEVFTDEPLPISNFKSARVYIEYYIGMKSSSDRTGGRIDLLITSDEATIAIENKIYAQEQEHQLERYYNSLKDPKILYLTLYGENSEVHDTLHDKDIKYHPIAYNEHIINWLNQCLQLSTDKPLLREGIKHYLNLIKHLTGQTTNTAMKNEIAQSIINDDTRFKGFTELMKVQQEVRKTLLKEYFFPLLNTITNEVNNELNLEGDKIIKLDFNDAAQKYFLKDKKPYKSFNFYSGQAKSLGIKEFRFEFISKKGWSPMVYGVKHNLNSNRSEQEINEFKSKVSTHLTDKLQAQLKTGHESWIGFFDLMEYPSLDSFEDLYNIKSDDYKETLKQKLISLVNVVYSLY